MRRKLLLTSFRPWKTHHQSNSSDDLLREIAATYSHFSSSLHYLRRLPVNFELAPKLTINKISQLQPDAMLLCGMAEHRIKLNVESNAVVDKETYQTNVDLENLVSGLTHTEISHDIGTFVCNRLYFEVLKHCTDKHPHKPCVFVHVPLIGDHNRSVLRNEFRTLIERISVLH